MSTSFTRKEELKDEAETAKKERIVTKVYRLNYIRADELMVMITPFLERRRRPEAIRDIGQLPVRESASPRPWPQAVRASARAAAVEGWECRLGGGSGGRAVQERSMRHSAYPRGASSMASNDVVVIQDYESNLKIIDQIIAAARRPAGTSLIEAVIISVELGTRTTQLGVNFAVVDNLGQQLGTIGCGIR